MRKLLVLVYVGALLGSLVPSVVFAQVYLDPQVSISPTTALSVGSSATLSVVMQNSSSASSASGTAKIYIPNVFTVGSQTGCVHITGPSSSGSNLVFNWTQVPDNGSPLPPSQSTPACKFPLTLNSLPSGTIQAKVDATTSSGTRSGAVTFNINTPAPTFTQALHAAVNQQNVTLTFKAANANSCTASATPAVTGWSGTVCSSANACGNFSKPLSNVPPGTYTFKAICTNATGSTPSSTSPTTVGSTSADVSASLALAPNASSPPYVVGTSVALAFTVANAAGAGSATNVKATFEVLNSALFSGITSDKCGAANNGKIVWNVGNLGAGQTLTCTITGRVAAATAPINLSGAVDATETDSNPANNTDTLALQTYQKPATKSKTVSGAATTKDSTHVALNRDGSVALFQSKETDLVQVNHQVAGGQDVYSVTGNQTVLETQTSGGQLMGTSSLPAIADDGSVVAFSHTNSITASVAAVDATAEVITGQIFAGSSGQPKHQVDPGANQPATGAPSVASAGGSKKLVFCSAANNLVSDDTNGARDVFLADPLNPGQPLKRISTDSNEQQLAGDSCEPAISADGTKVVFTLSSTTLYGIAARQVVRKDLLTHKLEVISRTPSGAYANNDNSEPSINADGSVIAFTSKASNLDGAPAGGQEVLVSVAQSGTDDSPRYLKRARSAGTSPNGGSQHPHLSNDGLLLAMQTAATNFFGIATAAPASIDSTPAPTCGSVVITTNYFNSSQVGQCGSSSNNQNPVTSGDGTNTGYDSNAQQAGTSSNNRNTYTQGVAGKDIHGESTLNRDLSGQWFDRNQDGQGLVIHVVAPGTDGARLLEVVWFVYAAGVPTWIYGTGTAQAAGESVVVHVPANILAGTAFPHGGNPVDWGSIDLTFTDSANGAMSWTSAYPGFAPGKMALSRIQDVVVGLPAEDAAGAGIRSCYSGNWYDSTNDGAGFELEVIPSNPPRLVVDWFAFDPMGAPVWLSGSGQAAATGSNTVEVPLDIYGGAGALFPPKYDASGVSPSHWGSATFTFNDATHGKVTWSSSVSGYAGGSQSLQPLYRLDRRSCD